MRVEVNQVNKCMYSGVGTTLLVFYSGYHVTTLFQNLQKISVTWLWHSPLHTCYPQWSMIILSVLELDIPHREGTSNFHLVTCWAALWVWAQGTFTSTQSLDSSVVFPGYSVSSTNKTDRHNISEILLKVVLNAITLTPIIPSLYLDVM